VWNDIYSGSINADILIFGSSRARSHICSKILEDSLNRSVYNLGIEGQNFWLQYLRYKEYLKKNKCPKFIIISIDLWMLDKRTDLYNYQQFLPYMLFNKNIFDYTSSYDGFSFFEYFFPMVRYIGEREAISEAFKNIVYPSVDTLHREKGYYAKEMAWNDDFDKAKASLRYWESKPDSATVVLFNKFLLDCKEKNIGVVFVYTPEYIEGQKFTKNRADIISYFEDISKDEGLSFLDYSADEMSKDRNNFINVSHLTRSKTLVFSRKFVSDLKRHNEITGIDNSN